MTCPNCHTPLDLPELVWLQKQLETRGAEYHLCPLHVAARLLAAYAAEDAKELVEALQLVVDYETLNVVAFVAKYPHLDHSPESPWLPIAKAALAKREKDALLGGQR